MAIERTPSGELAGGSGAQPATSSPELATEKPRYARSWVNVLADWVERLPGPSWLTYIVLAALGAAGNVAFAFWGSATRAVSEPVLAILGAFPVLLLWAFHHLADVAGDAFEQFRPALDGADTDTARLRFELTVVPARVGWIALLIAALAPPVAGIGGEPVEFALRVAVSAVSGALALVLVYHASRQLWTVERVHARAIRIDLFRAPPLFAFSMLTSRTAIILAVLVIVTAVVSPTITPIGLAVSGSLLALAVAVFVVPLRGMRRRIVAEKHRLQIEVGARIETTIARIHGAVDRDDPEAAARMHDALAVLVMERDLIDRLPTLPWRPTTAGAVLSVTVLPIVLFVVQRLISQTI